LQHVQSLATAPSPPPTDSATLWGRLADATDARAFCEAWLALLCTQHPGTRAGLLVLAESANTFVPAAVWPAAGADLATLGEVAKRALQERRGEVVPGEPACIGYPVEVDGAIQGAVALQVVATSEAALQDALRALHWGAGRLEVILQQRALDQSRRAGDRARLALDITAHVGEEARLEEAALALANELATRLNCTRAAVGIEQRGRLRLKAVSHAASFEKKAEFVSALENAMEEAVDQRRTIVFPAPAPAASAGANGERPAVSIAHREIAGNGAACSVVLSTRGRVVGAITCLREEAFDGELVQQLEAIAALAGAHLEARRELSRWFGGKLADQVRQLARNLTDPRRPAFAAGAAVLVLALLFLAFAEGEYRVTARAVIEGEVQRAVVAPFDGFIGSAHARAGRTVTRGETLAVIDDRDLRVEQQRRLSEVEQAEGKYRDALAKMDRANVRILQAQLAEAEAQLALVEEKLARTALKAPFDGVVVSGDLSQMLASPVEKGKVLFEVAPLDAYRVILKVDEVDIRDVAAGKRGVLLLAGTAGREMPFVVKNISVASAEEGKNVFRVEAQLDKAVITLRPGMEGVGKISIGERRHLWIWTHAFFDWLHLKLWRWLP
jgi:multidrug resistance efflux pump